MYDFFDENNTQSELNLYKDENDEINENNEIDNNNTIDNDSDSEDLYSDSSYRLKKIKGKTIVLVESDNPWYLNKDKTIQIPYKKNIRLTENLYRPNADYGSYENKEYFDSKKKIKTQEKNQNQIIFLLFILFLLLFMYKKFYKNKNQQ